VGSSRRHGGAPLPDGTYFEPDIGSQFFPGKDSDPPAYFFSRHATAYGTLFSRPMLVWVAPESAPQTDPRLRVVPYGYDLYELGDGTYLLRPPYGDTTWYRFRSDLTSPTFDASDEHLRLEQPVFEFMRGEAYAVARAMDAEALRRGRPRVDPHVAADFHLLLQVKRIIHLRRTDPRADPRTAADFQPFFQLRGIPQLRRR
jgi:hypothetical protein